MIRDILAKLELLPYGGTQHLDPDHRPEHGGKSRPPAGVELRPSDLEPDKDRVSLFEWYRWQFQRHALDPDRLRALYLAAVSDYMDFRFRSERRIRRRQGTLDERDAADPGKAERIAAERVVRDYEGKPALYVAIIEGQTEEWVRKARRQHNCYPDDGRRRPEFYGWSEKIRSATVRRLAGQLPSKLAVAEHLGVDDKTVARYWPKAERAKAAA